MATTSEDFRIDIAKEQSFKYLQAKQFDHGSRERRLIITDSNIPLTYKGNEYIVFTMKDGEDNYANEPCLFRDDGYPYITFTEGMLSHYGDIDCEIRIFDTYDAVADSSTVTTTFSFKMTISQSLMNYDRLVESSEFNILNNLILQAMTIPDLIKEFNLSQDEINALIVKINNDISSYQTTFNQLSTDAQNLISDVQDFLTTATASEEGRVAAEKQRETNEAVREEVISKAVADAVEATNNTLQAIADAVDATAKTTAAIEEAYTSAIAANAAREQCLAAIEGFHFEVVDMNGGHAVTGAETYDKDYNGGGA